MEFSPNTNSLAIVTPLANEQSTIGEFLSRVSRQLGPEDRHYCVFDNACTDGTKEFVQQHSENDPRVEAVWAPKSRCVVDAYFAGYRAALAGDAEWIIEMDGGLSHQPEEIEKYRTAIATGKYDYIGGCRFMKGGAHNGDLKRRSISWAGGKLANLVLGTQLKDMTGGFQCFRREALELVVQQGVKSRAHFFQTEIKFLLRNHRCLEIPIVYQSPSASVNGGVIFESIKNLARLASEARRAA